MKTFFTYIGTALFAVITTLTTGCSNVGGTRIVNAATPAVGSGFTTQTTYQTVERTVPPAAKVGLEVYGNQPTVPTDAAKANQTTWGQTFGNSMAYNEMRPHSWARLETPSADTRILVDQTNGWTWKVGCHNRIVVAQSQTITEQIPQTIQVPVQQQVAAAPAGGIHVDNSVHVDLKGAAGAVMKPVAAVVGIAGQALLQQGGCRTERYIPQPDCREVRDLPPRKGGKVPNCPRCGRFHPFKPCSRVAQQQGGEVRVNVHNVDINGNRNGVIPVNGSSNRPSYSSGGGTFSSPSRRPNGLAVDPRLVSYDSNNPAYSAYDQHARLIKKVRR